MSAFARCPALLIAAPASGQGKTTVTAALARLYTRKGLKVRVQQSDLWVSLLEVLH